MNDLSTNNLGASGANVLVTGGRGFIGSHLVRLLAAKGCNVVVVDLKVGFPSQTHKVIQLTADIRDRVFMEDLFRQYRFQCVYDLASFTEVSLSAKEYQRNVMQTEAMVDLVARHKTPKYIFYSTQFVFRKRDCLPIDEEDYAPTEAYGESKIMSEKLIRKSLPIDQWLILRPTYIWGPGLERFRDGLLLRLAKKEFLVSNDEALGRYYGYVETIVAQTYALSLYDFASLSRKVYYLSDDAIPLPQFCDHLVSALGQGGARKASPTVIRVLGEIGGLMSKCGLRAPINPVQAREMTTRFPVPIQHTLNLAYCTTDYPIAAARTVRWALENPSFVARIGKAQ
jgi:nucleoside-diphosphate-sugar epimerase